MQNETCTLPEVRYAELKDWIEFDGKRFIGMGSIKKFDKDGALLSYTIAPTGLVGGCA